MNIKKRSPMELPQEIKSLDSKIAKYEELLSTAQWEREAVKLRTGFCFEFDALFHNYTIRKAYNFSGGEPRDCSAETRSRLGNQCQLLHEMTKALHIHQGGADEWGEYSEHDTHPTAYDILNFLWKDAPLEALKEIVAYREKEEGHE